jgi:hypothetical protein
VSSTVTAMGARLCHRATPRAAPAGCEHGRPARSTSATLIRITHRRCG